MNCKLRFSLNVLHSPGAIHAPITAQLRIPAEVQVLELGAGTNHLEECWGRGIGNLCLGHGERRQGRGRGLDERCELARSAVSADCSPTARE